MKSKYSLITIVALFFAYAVAVIGCKKTGDLLVTPPTQAEFLTSTGSYYVSNSSSSSFKIPVGITSSLTKSTNVSIGVTSPTGAVSGTQYTLPSTTVIIPAGSVIDSLTVKGIFAGYPGTRKDTLTFTIASGDVPALTTNSTYKLIVQKYCDVVGANLIGNYTKCTDIYNGTASTKPNYTASISNFTPLTATTASIIIKNLGATSDNGWGPFNATDPVTTPGLTATLDWSNPASFAISIPLQNYFNDGTGISTIRATGTFSACDNTFNIVCSVKYTNGNTYTHTSVFNR